jgi:hypothetical protein
MIIFKIIVIILLILIISQHEVDIVGGIFKLIGAVDKFQKQIRGIESWPIISK